MEFNRCYGCMGELETPGAVCPRCGYDNTNDPGRQPNHVLPCGTVLNGQYLVGRSLGQGGFGITYIGYDMNLEIPVCIKEYYPEGSAMRSANQSRIYWGASESAQERKESRRDFVKEAQKAVKLRDLTHVVTVWGVFYENETAYIIMDYIEGETLRKRLVRTQKTLGEKECVELLTPVMEDLQKAHARGIIHRDIKPDNIMLRTDGEPVLLDMGAAKDLGKKSGTSSTVAAVSYGFSPKEQYRRKGNIGPWTDVYAMCATIYYCVSGRVPPDSLDRDDGVEMDLHAFSPAVARVLERGMALRVEDRIQTMGGLLMELQAATGRPGKDRGTERPEREKRGEPAEKAPPENRKKSVVPDAAEIRYADDITSFSPTTITDAMGNVYVGTVKDGQENGYGTMTYAQNDANGRLKYEGEWKDGKREGTGKLTWTSGEVYEGEWKDDEIEGQGTYTWPNGKVYKGECRNGKQDGRGTMTFAKNDENGRLKYEGEWRNGKREGRGTMTFVKNDENGRLKYEGEWRNSERDGTGTITWSNGEVYKGEWKGDRIEGWGTMTYAKNDANGRLKYEGEWSNGKRDGTGTITWTDGEVYRGEWKDDAIEGRGSYTWPNGNIYEGEWKNGKREGQGIKTYADGRKETGFWKDDKFVGSVQPRTAPRSETETGTGNNAGAEQKRTAYVRQQIAERNAGIGGALPVGLSINEKGLYAYAFNMCTGQALELYKRDFQPGEGAAAVLGPRGFEQMIVETVEKLQTYYAIRDIILTLSVPQDFGFAERIRIQELAKNAGIHIWRIIPEADAAVLYHSHMTGTENESFVLFVTMADKLPVCVLYEISDGIIEELEAFRLPLGEEGKKRLKGWGTECVKDTVLLCFNLPAETGVLARLKNDLRTTGFAGLAVQSIFPGAAAAGSAIQSAIFGCEVERIILLEMTNSAMLFSVKEYSEVMIDQFTTIPTRKSQRIELDGTSMIRIKEDRGTGRLWDLGSVFVDLCEKTPVEITFDVDANWKLDVTVRDEKTNKLLGKL